MQAVAKEGREREEKRGGKGKKMQIIPHKGSSQIGVTISQIISLLYFENVNLLSGFPGGVE